MVEGQQASGPVIDGHIMPFEAVEAVGSARGVDEDSQRAAGAEDMESVSSLARRRRSSSESPLICGGSTFILHLLLR